MKPFALFATLIITKNADAFQLHAHKNPLPLKTRMNASSKDMPDDKLFGDLFDDIHPNTPLTDKEIHSSLNEVTKKQKEQEVQKVIKEQENLMTNLRIRAARIHDLDKMSLIKKILRTLKSEEAISREDKFIQPFTYYLRRYPSALNLLYLNDKSLNFEQAKKLLKKHNIDAPIRPSYLSTQHKLESGQFRYILSKCHFDPDFFEKKSFIKIKDNKIESHEAAILRAQYVGDDAWGEDVPIYFLVSLTKDSKLRLLDMAKSPKELGNVF